MSLHSWQPWWFSSVWPRKMRSPSIKSTILCSLSLLGQYLQRLTLTHTIHYTGISYVLSCHSMDVKSHVHEMIMLIVWHILMVMGLPGNPLKPSLWKFILPKLFEHPSGSCFIFMCLCWSQGYIKPHIFPCDGWDADFSRHSLFLCCVPCHWCQPYRVTIL